MNQIKVFKHESLTPHHTQFQLKSNSFKIKFANSTPYLVHWLLFEAK